MSQDPSVRAFLDEAARAVLREVALKLLGWADRPAEAPPRLYVVREAQQ